MRIASVILRKSISTVILLLTAGMSYSQTNQKADSTKTYEIPELTVTEKQSVSEVRSTAPLQVLSANNLRKLNVLQVSDAVKHFSGVVIKDYGGVGGLKTVSVRGLGSTHTTVMYDGIPISDAQTGQIDIGRFSLDNVDMLSLINGQSDNIFQPARAFNSASVLNFRSNPPVFKKGKIIQGKATIKGGSFGFINPSIKLEGKVNNKLSATLSGEYMYSNGEYPFKLHYGNEKGDSTSVEKRKNTDVENFRIEGALFGNFSKKENAYLKVYYYQSERGLPGSIILYNVNQNATQRIWDKTFFVQGNYKYDFSKSFAFQANGKYNYTWLNHLNEGWIKTDNTYAQQEYYLSASLLYRAFKNMSFSLSTDGTVNSMKSDLIDFAYPTRYSLLTVLSAKYVNNKILATASVLNTTVKETVKFGNKANNHFRFSPYASLSYKPFKTQDLRLRVFYKNIFRLPTFNDLYYTNIGNYRLKPENTDQFNIGFTYASSFSKIIPFFSATMDGYHNNITDKIVAYPTKDLFVWTTLNLDKVSINGIDATMDITLQLHEKVGLNLGVTYTYQRALNTTEPDNPYTYKHQVPYTPRVCGSGKAGIETPWININYSLIWSGHRYSLPQNYVANRLEGYYDHSISASRDFDLPFGVFSANFEILNLTDKNYEVVRYFPMPGRAFRLTMSFAY